MSSKQPQARSKEVEPTEGQIQEEHRDLLRFLWWLDGDSSKEVIDYRMKVHLFGASSSPGCAKFGLRRAADDGEEEFGTDAAAFIRKDFYVDDGLKSVSTVPEAIQLIKASQAICSKACLRLRKIVSNKKEVLGAFPVDDHSKEIKELNLAVDPLPIERALGVMWCAESDSSRFRIELHDRPLTRRGVLSTIGSIYDPNGYLPLLHSEVNRFFSRCAKTSWIGIALFQSIYTHSVKRGGEKSYSWRNNNNNIFISYIKYTNITPPANSKANRGRN